MSAEETCSVCRKPEGRNYKPPNNSDYVCSNCVQLSINMSRRYCGQLGRNKKQAHQFDHVDFKRGYIRALFSEDQRWVTALTKYSTIVPGNPKSKTVIASDIALKEELADQVHPDTYQQRKAYFEAWVNAKCCANDCDRYCDECHGIRFEPVPSRIAKMFDPDVRRFIEKYQRFWLTSEQDKSLIDIRGDVVNANGRKVSDEAYGNDPVWNRVRKRTGRSGELEEDSSDPYQRQKESFLCPRPGGMAFEKSFEYWGQ